MFLAPISIYLPFFQECEGFDAEKAGGTSSNGRVLRIIKTLRMFKILRLLKAVRVVQ